MDEQDGLRAAGRVPAPAGRVLAIDVGTVRLGLALSCPLGMVAQPLEVVHRRRVDARARVAAIVAERGVTALVVGRPLTLAGDAAQAVHACERFVADLYEPAGPLPRTLPLVWWDERLTTAQAQRAMVAAGTRRERRRDAVDMVAAALLLQSYLDARI